MDGIINIVAPNYVLAAEYARQHNIPAAKARYIGDADALRGCSSVIVVHLPERADGFRRDYVETMRVLHELEASGLISVTRVSR